MTRSERMAPVQRVFGETERDRARELGEAQQRLAAAETRLAELRAYHSDYQGAFRRRASDGTSIRSLRDFQAFLARLDEALRQQEQIVAAAREQAAGSRRSWQGAARQVQAMDSVVGRWQQAEVRAGERLEQKQSDERALRAALARKDTEEGR